MKKLCLIVLLILSTSVVFAQNQMSQKDFVSYYEMGKFMQSAPGAFRFGGLGYENPAVLATMGEWSELSLFANGGSDVDYSFGGFTNTGGLGLGTILHRVGDKQFWDNRISLGFGNRTFGLGVAYSSIGGDKKEFGLSDSWIFGALYRPSEFISIGYHYRLAYQNEVAEHVAEVGLRPIPKYPLTIYADASLHSEDELKGSNLDWSAGLSWEFIDGVRLNARYMDSKYFNDEAVTVGVDFSVGRSAVSYQANAYQDVDNNMSLGSSTYALRYSKHKDRTFLEGFGVDKRHKHIVLSMNAMKDKLGVSSIFDPSAGFRSLLGKNQLDLLEVLKKLDYLKKDKAVNTVYLNMQEFATFSYSDLWEIREKIKEVQESGIKFIIFAEALEIKTYHFASIADEIYLDPLGMVMLQGFSMGRSYYKDLLDKYGVGYEEIRLFKYKSAVESFARSEQSEGDREQRQKYIDDLYGFAKKEISEARGISIDKIDELSNKHLLILANNAEKENLITGQARWRNIDSLISKKSKKNKLTFESWRINTVVPNDDLWSEKEKQEIAIVYASGACMMEGGIEARKLARIMENVCSKSSTKAVILRVNSPGGSAMASDLVAEVVRKYKGKKPIIVSQGSLAASGGYWLSMDADTIVATPMTITGSIGVIASWVYDKGFSDTLGINYQVVKAGNYSDLGSPVTLPLIGLGLPARNLKQDERSQLEDMISNSYALFVNSVAEGRGMDSAKVHELAQGRIYSGIHGKEVGLVDEIGGLQKAIDIAKERLNIAKDDEIRLREYKPKSGFNLMDLFVSYSYDMTSSFDGTNQAMKKIIQDKVLEDLEMRIENNGKPMLLIPMDYYKD